MIQRGNIVVKDNELKVDRGDGEFIARRTIDVTGMPGTTCPGTRSRPELRRRTRPVTQRILVINPNSNQAVTDGLGEAFEPPAWDGDVELSFATITDGPFGIETDDDIASVAPKGGATHPEESELRCLRHRLLFGSRSGFRTHAFRCTHLWHPRKCRIPVRDPRASFRRHRARPRVRSAPHRLCPRPRAAGVSCR